MSLTPDGPGALDVSAPCSVMSVLSLTPEAPALSPGIGPPNGLFRDGYAAPVNEPVAEFKDPWEARLARHFLADAGIEAWLEPDRKLDDQGWGGVWLVVEAEEAEEARALLDEMPAAHDDLPAERRGGRPLWVMLAAAVTLVALVVAAVPPNLWPWLILFGFVGFLLWRAVGPRRP